MNDEIKETLEYKIDFLTKSLNIGIPTKNRRYFNDIRDYITNLQQIEQDHKQVNATLMQELTRLQNRLDKAIEYINNTIEDKPLTDFDCGSNNACNDLLNILQGSDKDDE